MNCVATGLFGAAKDGNNLGVEFQPFISARNRRFTWRGSQHVTSGPTFLPHSFGCSLLANFIRAISCTKFNA